ncbi:hypothetical protein HDU91_005323 [Kappamyces sp. JEL0680]|nr:hypothetical protein HDU91_005323 [Kappamyces sp. JEL0680]
MSLRKYPSQESTLSEWREKLEKGQVSLRSTGARGATPSSSRMRDCQNWYCGHPSSALDKKYCGRRMGKCSFVCLHVCLALVLVLVVLIPVLYCVVVPANIQSHFDALFQDPLSGDHSSNMTVSSGAAAQSLMHMEYSTSYYSFMPGSVTIVGPTNFTLADQTSHPFANFVISSVTVPLNQAGTRVGFDGNITIVSIPSISTLWSSFTNSDLVIQISAPLTIQVHPPANR